MDERRAILDYRPAGEAEATLRAEVERLTGWLRAIGRGARSDSRIKTMERVGRALAGEEDPA